MYALHYVTIMRATCVCMYALYVNGYLIKNSCTTWNQMVFEQNTYSVCLCVCARAYMRRHVCAAIMVMVAGISDDDQ